jgi:Predicted nucleic acid-binding protein, contains PIN domain
MHLVDSSIIIAILTGEKNAADLFATLKELRAAGGAFVNQIVFSETTALADSEEQAEKWLRPLADRHDLPWKACFPAAQAFRLYRTRGGKKERMLPDFLIAAHADAMGWKLFTNNAADIRNYFPRLKILTP